MVILKRIGQKSQKWNVAIFKGNLIIYKGIALNIKIKKGDRYEKIIK